MKIAIYGDSYANMNLDEPNDGRGMSWVDVVKQKHDVTNFGHAGTSIYYSYLKFIENFANFDYNIFIITHPDRIYNRKLNEILERDSWYTNYNNIDVCSKDLTKSGFQLKIINSVKTYFEYWKDEETEAILNLNLVENLRNKQNNCLFVNAFSHEHCSALTNEHGLIDISGMEQITTGWLEKYRGKGMNFGYIDENNYVLEDHRLNHLCEENNIILGNKMVDAVNKKQQTLEIRLGDFVVPKHNIDFYVRWSKKL